MKFKLSTDPPPTFSSRLQLRWIALGFLLLILLAGCESEQDRIAKYQATLPPDNGKIVEVSGEKFRIVYIGGVRFRFPITAQFIWTGGKYATQPETDGINLGLYRLDVQTDKVSGIKLYRWFYGNLQKPGSISVQVRGRREPKIVDKSKNLGLPPYMHPSDYIVHDDLALGLKIFSPKEFPKTPEYAYPLTPLKHHIYMNTHTMYINYAPKVNVEVDIQDRSKLINPDWRRINSDWKGLYLETVEILNKYREDKQ